MAGSTYFGQKGKVVFHSTTEATGSGGTVTTFSDGHYFDRQPFSSFSYTFGSDGALQTELVNDKDGSHVLKGYTDGLILHSVGADILTGGGSAETFSFMPGFGHDLITDFQTRGSGHDQIQLLDTRFGNAGQVLAHTKDNGDGNAVIHLNPHDSITLLGVSTAQLAHNPVDFVFGH